MKKNNSKKEKLSLTEFWGLQLRIIILMTMPLAVHKVTGAINFPNDIAGIAARARYIYSKCSSSGITFIGAILADFLALIVAYEAASTDDRPGAYLLMNNKAQAILGFVQPLADASPLRAIGILHSCGFNVIPAHGAHIAEFSGAASASVRGAVDLITAGGPEKKSHLHIWFSSVDDGTTWLMVAATNKRKVTIPGYEHGKDVLFKTQLSIEDVLQPMSNIIPVLIN